jgi:hypothetical protein
VNFSGSFQGNEEIELWSLQKKVNMDTQSYQDASKRMRERGEEVNHCFHNVVNAKGPDRVEMSTRLSTTLFVMHKGMHVVEHRLGHAASHVKSKLTSGNKNAPGFFSRAVEKIVDGEIFGGAIVEIAKFGDAVVKNGIEFTEGNMGVPKAIIETTEKLKSIQEATEGDDNEHNHHESIRRNSY